MTKTLKNYLTYLGLLIITFLIGTWSIGYAVKYNLDLQRKNEQEILNYFCDDLKSWLCVSDGCYEELEKRTMMCKKIAL